MVKYILQAWRPEFVPFELQIVWKAYWTIGMVQDSTVRLLRSSKEGSWCMAYFFETVSTTYS